MTDRLHAILDALAAKLDGRGVVVDPAVRSAIVAAHADTGMPADAKVAIVRGRPAPAKALRELEGIVRDRFGAGLPADWRAFLERHDGLAVVELDGDVVPREVDLTDHALIPAAHAVALLGDLTLRMVDGGRAHDVTAPHVPFYDLVESGCVALSYGRDAAAPPVIDVDLELPWHEIDDRAPVLAQTFTDWLSAFVASGLEPGATAARLRT
jgi:hypothetical protein